MPEQVFFTIVPHEQWVKWRRVQKWVQKYQCCACPAYTIIHKPWNLYRVVTGLSAPILPLYISTVLAHIETASVVPLLSVPFSSPTSLNWQLHQIFCTLCTENICWTWTDILSSSLDLTLKTQALYLESFKELKTSDTYMNRISLKDWIIWNQNSFN